MATMVRPAVAERNYHVPRVQSPPRPQLQAQAVADNTYVPVQSFPPPSPSQPPPLPLGIQYNAAKPPQKGNYYLVAEVVLRILLFLFSLAALLILLTSKQTIELRTRDPPYHGPFSLKYNTYSPAFKYFLVAVSASSVYSLITTVFAFLNLCIKGSSRSGDVLYQLITTLDVVMLGILGSASGAATAITYVGLRGTSNSVFEWYSICDYYDTFCLHIGLSVISSLLASLVLIILISFSVSSLTQRIASSYAQVRNE
ncbi:hypothetical protein DCAR_0832465 [Daucus carota subsp. sativus]|uniref:CASP-like protein n=1 Tax=Daucus carota subsp. sativus TaxID=79200 RepID=A0AAF0XRK2_DAUCS|nr:PREDICTED: CASP-like protein 1 [Daucus carota subsp. sativus]WOH12956.1 hypothetical protein DCAR_0832465 [Daucus carota subsp. sativus]